MPGHLPLGPLQALLGREAPGRRNAEVGQWDRKELGGLSESVSRLGRGCALTAFNLVVTTNNT